MKTVFLALVAMVLLVQPAKAANPVVSTDSTLVAAVDMGTVGAVHGSVGFVGGHFVGGRRPLVIVGGGAGFHNHGGFGNNAFFARNVGYGGAGFNANFGSYGAGGCGAPIVVPPVVGTNFSFNATSYGGAGFNANVGNGCVFANGQFIRR